MALSDETLKNLLDVLQKLTLAIAAVSIALFSNVFLSHHEALVLAKQDLAKLREDLEILNDITPSVLLKLATNGEGRPDATQQVILRTWQGLSVVQAKLDFNKKYYDPVDPTLANKTFNQAKNLKELRQIWDAASLAQRYTVSLLDHAAITGYEQPRNQNSPIIRPNERLYPDIFRGAAWLSPLGPRPRYFLSIWHPGFVSEKSDDLSLSFLQDLDLIRRTKEQVKAAKNSLVATVAIIEYDLFDALDVNRDWTAYQARLWEIYDLLFDQRRDLLPCPPHKHGFSFYPPELIFVRSVKLRAHCSAIHETDSVFRSFLPDLRQRASFSETFPYLNQLSDDYQKQWLSALPSSLAAATDDSKDQVEIWGVKFSSNLIPLLGLPILFTLQLQFWTKQDTQNQKLSDWN